MNSTKKALMFLVAAEAVACYTIYCLAYGMEPFPFIPNLLIIAS